MKPGTPPTWVWHVPIARHMTSWPVRVLLLVLLRVRVLLFALLGGPLVAVWQLGQVLLGARLHIRLGEVVVLRMGRQGGRRVQEGSAGSSSVSVQAKEAGPAARVYADGRHAGRCMGTQAGAESAQAQDGSGRLGCGETRHAVPCCGVSLTKSASMAVMRLAGLSSSSLRSKSTASFGSCSNPAHHDVPQQHLF